ncbi:daptide-type RiPP [Streptomyces abyssomicinicus]|uniref:daptide-type RiPP n=1 Tax=Streptomyces abyssomicinicus TaxID=574929 RepID=UPI0013E0BD95|nr:daptide-type RiPP [Streptomyces abyssomicinicus]
MNKNHGVDNFELVEVEMQELESLEAPGFWTGVSTGVTISASVIASLASLT